MREMLHSTQPPLQAFRDSFCLVNSLYSASRWRKEPGATVCDYSIIIINLSTDLVANFKIQGSQVPYGDQDNITEVAIPPETVNDPYSPNGDTWSTIKGLFDASFVDIPEMSNISIVPCGMVTLNFSSDCPFIQFKPLTGNGCRIQLQVGTTQPIAVWSHEEAHPSSFDANDGSFPLIGISVNNINDA